MRDTKRDPYVVAAVQMSGTHGRAENLERAVAWIQQAARAGAQVVCLPELFLSHYFCQSEDPSVFDLAETIPGPTTTQFVGLARTLGVALVVPLFERRAPGLYFNSVAFINETGVLSGVYRKMHIPDDPGFYEKFYFTPGDLGFRSFETAWGRVGTLICWDQWYPEAARLTAMTGADVLCYPTAIGWSPAEKATCGVAQHDAWRTVQRGHAIANGVYVVAANRVGVESAPDGQSSIEFWGQSFIADPFGRLLTEGTVDREELLMATIDPQAIEATRRIWPFWRDRRVDVYQGFDHRWGADERT